LIPDPGFVSYDALTKLTGGRTGPGPAARRPHDRPRRDRGAAITDDTVAFVVNSPGNPTGAVSSEEDVREFARIADEHDVLCISDEVYEYTVFEGNTTRRWSSRDRQRRRDQLGLEAVLDDWLAARMGVRLRGARGAHAARPPVRAGLRVGAPPSTPLRLRCGAITGSSTR